MKKKTRSILEELSSIHGKRDTNLRIDSAGSNIIQSSINLLQQIHSTYDSDTALMLERKFLNSIRTGDMNKFKRSMQKIIEDNNKE